MTIHAQKQYDLKKALKVDFTGRYPQLEQFDCCDSTLITRLRQNPQPQENLVVLIDRGFGDLNPAPYIVADHINLTGTSPLVGPNPSCGTRFPVINGIYVKEAIGCGGSAVDLSQMEAVVVAGLKSGIEPNEKDIRAMKQFGANLWCFNIVPAMIVAAHAGWKVLAIVLLQGGNLPANLSSALD